MKKEEWQKFPPILKKPSKKAKTKKPQNNKNNSQNQKRSGSFK